MHRIFFSFMVLCITAQMSQAQDFWTQEDIDIYDKSAAARDCSIPANQDRWGIREPNEQELLEYGSGYLIFQYLNSLASCSNSTKDLGVWYDGERLVILTVETLGREYDSKERITVITAPESTHILEKPGSVLLKDTGEFHTWFLMKPMN